MLWKDSPVYLRKLDLFDAQAIKECVNELINCIIQSSGGSMVICLGADGASVMAGEFSGFAELFPSDYFHWLLYIHCTANRINLSVSDLIKGSNLALDIFSTEKPTPYIVESWKSQRSLSYCIQRALPSFTN